MRVMKAFEIQSNYQKHKQRLTNIKGFNAKKKVSSSTTKNIQLINNYKKNKLTSQIFFEKKKLDDISYNNQLIQKNLAKVYMRQTPSYKPHDKQLNKNNLTSTNKFLGRNQSIGRIKSKSSMKSFNSVQSSRIDKQNKRVSNRIKGSKSQYAKFRQTIKSSVGKNSNKRDQLVRILENQLGIKTKVVFPAVKKRNKSIGGNISQKNVLLKQSQQSNFKKQRPAIVKKFVDSHKNK